MSERWCPECEVTFTYGEACPTCGWQPPDMMDALDQRMTGYMNDLAPQVAFDMGVLRGRVMRLEAAIERVRLLKGVTADPIADDDWESAIIEVLSET